jgi:hypothetical protein
MNSPARGGVDRAPLSPEPRIPRAELITGLNERGQLQPRANVNRRTRGVEFARDSPLERAGFEPPVPLEEATVRDRFASF